MFWKYYVKLFLFLCDVSFTNAWIYYHLSNPTLTRKYGSRADFFEGIAEALVNPTTNWVEKGSMINEPLNDTLDECEQSSPYVNIKYPTESCTPVPMRALNVPLSTKIKVCQICHYKMRPYKWKSLAMCSKHGVHLCTDRRDPVKIVSQNL
jgi:hypothetical protein